MNYTNDIKSFLWRFDLSSEAIVSINDILIEWSIPIDAYEANAGEFILDAYDEAQTALCQYFDDQ
jgi:hypothetical protein